MVLHAAGGELTEQEFDFAGLHNISKHVIYLKEGTQAAVALVKHLSEGHQSLMGKVSSPERLELMRSVHELLLHKSSLLEGLALRIAGMESLAQNLINLVRKTLIFLCLIFGKLIPIKAFNIVNQKDSKALKEDSRAMKVIVIMTMLFLPTTAVAVSDLSLLPRTVRRG